jgi:hypothetical protein
MGRARGSDVMTSIIIGANMRFPHDPEIRRDIYGIVITAFDGNDWDTHDECLGHDEEFDEALKMRVYRN